MDTEIKLLQALRKIGQKYSNNPQFSSPLHKRKERAMLEMNGVVESAEMLGDGEEIRRWIPTIMHDYVETDTFIKQQQDPR